MQIYANILHNAIEDSYYKKILTSFGNSELILTPSITIIPGQIDPFRTKSKIMHSPPQSPFKMSSSQENYFEENSQKSAESRSIFVNKVFNEREDDLLEDLRERFSEFINNKKSVVIINWFNRLSETHFSKILKNNHKNNENLQFSISNFPLENENKKKFYNDIRLWETEFQAVQNSKKNFNAILYDFKNKTGNALKPHFIILDLFNIVDKFNNVNNFHDGLNSIGKQIYNVFTDKSFEESSFFYVETSQIFKKIMKNSNFSMISILNFKNIEPYYHQSLLQMKFIEELSEIEKKLKNSFFFQILTANQKKYQKKVQNLINKTDETEKKFLISQASLEKMRKELEEIKFQMRNKEELMKKLSIERSIAAEDKSFLEGILQETVSNSPENSEMKAVEINELYEKGNVICFLLVNY